MFPQTLWSIFLEALDNIFVHSAQQGYEFMQNRTGPSKCSPPVMRQEITIFFRAADDINNATTYHRTKPIPQVSAGYKFSTICVPQFLQF